LVGVDGEVRASVIIPTRNRADILGRCLESLTRQTLTPEAFEVLVIDNGSKDHTANIAKKYTGSLQITYAYAPEPGLHIGRHAGLRRAQADVLIFTDDDIEAEPTWVEAVVETFQDPKIALIGGNNYPNFEVDPPPWLLHWWQQRKHRGHALNSLSILDFGEGVFEIDPGYVWGCNFSIRRNVLLKARGFHPDGVPAERLRFRGDGETYVSDVVRNSGLRTVFNSRASVRHRVSENRMTRTYIEQRAYAQGISDSYTIIRRSGGLKTPITLNARRKLRFIRTELTTLIHSAMNISDSVRRELCAVQRSALLAYRRGYDFHRREASNDSALLDWVLKQDYLECSI
jgi:glycosyltransferase involved in cell wall biosynthesis